MSLSDIVHLDPALIIVNREGRQRQRNLTIDDLIPSIKARGILHPILINEDFTLVAGERRLRTAIHLSMATVPTRQFSSLSETDQKLIELEENLRRLDLTWQDKALSFLALHNLYSAAHPVGEWTTTQTAGMIGYHDRTVEKMIELGEAIANGDASIRDAESSANATTILTRRKERAGAAAIGQLLDMERIAAPAEEIDEGPQPPIPSAEGSTPPTVIIRSSAVAAPKHQVVCADFAEWAQDYSGPRFNFLHCDFPYGVALNGQAHQDHFEEGGYDGGEDLYWYLLGILGGAFDRLLLPSAHIMFWISMKHYTTTMEFLSSIKGLRMNPTPLVWHKTDNRGILPDPHRGPRQTYEAALIGAVGDRFIVKSVANSYGAPTGKADAIHTNEKPEPMLNHFLSMFVDEHTRMLDPTCGGGSSIRSAEGLGAEFSLGLEINPEFANRAQSALLTARTLRALSQKQTTEVS